MHIISSMDVQAQGWPRAMHSGSEYASDGNHQLFKKKEQYRVFLVEDDLDDRRLTIQSLRQSPYIDKIHSFESGDRLIEYFIREGYYSGNLMRYLPTLVILDIHVPGSSGLSTLRKLKEHPLTEDIPVIILTSDASGKNAAKAYKYKASAFMNKPVDMERIHEVIDTGWSWPEDNIPQ